MSEEGGGVERAGSHVHGDVKRCGAAKQVLQRGICCVNLVIETSRQRRAERMALGIAVGIGEVFEAFTRLEGSRNKETGGIGLGLALARAIVREARGDITLLNRPDGGLAATITLPR